MGKLFMLAVLVAYGATASAADDAMARLRGARSLRCGFTSSVLTSVRSGHRSVDQTNDKGSAVYDSIDIVKGTGRIIANGGAGDLVVWRDLQGNLWMLELAPSGNEIVTTVFPMYAEGTNEFVVLESRHWMAIGGQIASGEIAFGSCKVLE